jgi:hypothetical protein
MSFTEERILKIIDAVDEFEKEVGTDAKELVNILKEVKEKITFD